MTFERKNGASGGADPEVLAKEVKGLMDDAKATAEKAIAEVKRLDGVTAETKAAADALLPKLAEASQRLADLEQKMAAPARQQPQVAGSWGQQFIGSDAFKSANYGITSGVEMKTLITSGPASAGAFIQADRVAGVDMPRRRLTIRDLVAPGSTGSNSIEYYRQTARNNAAAETAEGAAKPESAYAWTLVQSPVQTIAHWVPITRQAFDDAAGLASTIDSELRYGLDLREEGQLLAGTGVAPQLHGIIPQATAYVAAFAPASPTLIDQIRLAILQVALTDVPADGIVMHPTDWARVETTKDAAGYYIAGNPQGGIPNRLWGFPVVDTQAIEVDKFLVGAFQAGAQIFDRMAPEVMISTEHDDYFVKNKLAVRAEKRLAFAVRRPSAFVYGDFGFVP